MALLRDYDFNDVALLSIVLKLNAKGLAVQMDFICNKSNGAEFYERNMN
jgi:hypothetical protein